eukprot:TRINITY_DN2623_c0_g1_i1.p1 TRINITY_DN2623_c0_g1~~TRINITY_DN2623_c0_g1_i1.p1  ORF type:complete len:282 (+),score=83.84 TRINITY_DN2623_c0_g1_i1:62-847(+)
MLQLLLIAAAISVDPPQWMIDADAKFSALYNAQNFTGVQSIYNPGAQLIPPGAGKFLVQAELADFFASAYSSGLRSLSLRPVHVLQESDSLWHEIGETQDTSGNGTYYVRWIKTAAGEWQIAFDCMSIGVPSTAMQRLAGQGGVAGPVAPPAWLVKRSTDSVQMWNAKNYTGLVSWFNPGAQFVPYSADSFIKQPDLASYLASLPYVAEQSCEVTLVFEESPTLLHVILEVRTAYGSSKVYLRYFLNGNDWQIAFELSLIS